MSTTPSPAPSPLTMAEVLRIPAMRRMWYAQIISVFGDVLALFAVIGILTFRLHATPRQIIGVQIAYMLPIAILGVLAGVFVDRWPVKPTMVASDATRAVLVLLLMVSHTVWHFYAVLAAISVISSFFGPAQGVALRAVVPMHGLRSANALMQQVMFGMRIVGPATAAFMVSALGPRSCYLADSASFVGSALLIASVTLSGVQTAALHTLQDAPEHSGLARIVQDMRQGIHFIVHHAALLFVILAMASGMFVMGCFGPLIAIYVRDNIHADTRIFGIAQAMIAVGMFGGINGLNAFAKKVRNTVLVYSGLAGIATGLAILTLLTHIWSTILGNLTIGVAVAGIIIPAQTLIQQETPHALMGRVGSTVMSIIFASQIAGLILSGQLAQYLGVRQVFATSGVLLVMLMIAGRLWMEPKHAEPAAS
ncbi:MAG: MFS transporter [Acidobacteriota bacterium]|nr:MFS transporter [Acidobacteriota bacterium]